MSKPDRELQFLHWLGKAAEFRKTMKGKQMLDPATLTPATLYKLQSDTWAQGAEHERERIIKLLEEYLSAFGAPQEQLMQRRMTDFIALIKGETE